MESLLQLFSLLHAVAISNTLYSRVQLFYCWMNACFERVWVGRQLRIVHAFDASLTRPAFCVAVNVSPSYVVYDEDMMQ